MLAIISTALPRRPIGRRHPRTILSALSIVPLARNNFELTRPATRILRCSSDVSFPPDASGVCSCLSLHCEGSKTRATQELSCRRAGGWYVGASIDWKTQQHGTSSPHNASIIRYFSSQTMKVGQDSADNNASEDDKQSEVSEETPLWNNQNFVKMFEELKEFEAKFGSFAVPEVYPPNPKLFKWVLYLHESLDKSRKGEKGPLTKDQVRQLEDLGFCQSRWLNVSDQRWLKMYYQLREFKEIHGHCNVSGHSSLHHKLGRWVQTQRCGYTNESPYLTPEKIRMLEDLSFEWRLHDRKIWWYEYKLLRKYWEEHGDCNVPTDTPEGLNQAEWATVQRRHYKRRQQGDYSFLTDDRVQALNDIGFIWDKFDARWMEHFYQLRKFRWQYGHW
uniref:Helicase-associated domain-containing protein n=1 Tax=Odontella aurita TaxID=265563 RepID=A0A7S4IX66_9STRA|mmetsp:Transcript_31960/g.95710  ORF Transcript_31960/g.95710 Transcript_31960/m.95710 type:complete len:390 (+) Transcript_31960:142-1311(+)